MSPHMIRWAFGSIVVAVLVSPISASAATCSRFDLCPTDNSVIQMRQLYSRVDWTIFHKPVGPGVRIAFTDDEYKRMVSDAFWNYASVNYPVPYDNAVWIENGGDDNFQWGWVDQATLRNDPDAELFVPAGMGRNWTDCFITVSIGKFAYNPGEGVDTMQWVPDYCYPPCQMNGFPGDRQLDFKGIAMHEYGHALGLDDVDAFESTMYESGSPTGGWQDTLKRTLRACEIEHIASRYNDNNPAATVTGYTVTRSGGGITVSWLAEQESSTDHYVIARGDGPNGPFTPVQSVPVSGTGTYAVVVPGGTPGFYQLTEVEIDGDVWSLKSEPDAEPGSLPQFVQQSINFDSTMTALVQNQTRPESITNGPTQFYIYCPDSMEVDFQVMADVHSSYDILTEVVTYESLGGPRGVKEHIAANLPSGGWILKVGDAWDGRDLDGQLWAKNPALYVSNGFTMPAWPDQPELNIAPLTYLREYAHQSVSRNYWSPYGATPWTDVDFNNDGRPDANYYLGYAPVSNRTEAQVFIAKSIQQIFTYPSPPANMMPPAVMMTYGRNFGSNSGAKALGMANRLRQNLQEINPSLLVISTTTSDANPLTTAQRNAALKAKFDGGMSSCTFVSTVSQRYELGAYAHVDIPGYYFDVNALAANGIQCFGIGVTCEMGFSRIEDPAYGTPVTERLLFVPSRGLWGWFGPDRGSFQGGNERIGAIFHRRQYSTPLGGTPPTVGELANQTVNEAAAFRPDSLLAISYVLVGNPRGRIPTPSNAVVDVEPLTPTDRPLSVTPNPTLGAARFSFALAKPSRVDLAIYDVAGRRVASIIESELPAGSHQASWSNPGDQHRSARSGVYLARLRVGDRTWNQKFVIVH